jgi:hypothetical protein
MKAKSKKPRSLTCQEMILLGRWGSLRTWHLRNEPTTSDSLANPPGPPGGSHSFPTIAALRFPP